eukprot:TRINITY_DN9425_c0_g2_i1.p1 TRINITY_DN9425_c0_g2~~TRINITY_DN9425_c0_g2_i1.p1  ORF type:complete len:192 (-),score=15.22 TRINITY_DN9425_c0_g2_i1:220-795(-)
MSSDKIDDKIWITARVRMLSERKLINFQNISYIVFTYYAVFLVIISVFSNYYKVFYESFDQFNISASIIVLVASLVAGGFRFEARANFFRECYLKLQRLVDEDLEDKPKSDKYNDILWDYPNHTARDYCDFVVNHTLIEGKELRSGGVDLLPTKFMILSYFLRKIVFYIFVLFLILSPLFFVLYPLVARVS